MLYVGLKEHLKLGYVKLGLLELDVSWKKIVYFRYVYLHQISNCIILFVFLTCTCILFGVYHVHAKYILICEK